MHHPDMHELLTAAARPEGLSAELAAAALDGILASTMSTEQGAALLIAMRQRGETPLELSVWVRGLLAKAIPVDLGRPVMDVVGTGGSGRARYNASTTACFVLAAAGVPIANGHSGFLLGTDNIPREDVLRLQQPQYDVTLPSVHGTARSLLDAILASNDRQTNWALLYSVDVLSCLLYTSPSPRD